MKHVFDTKVSEEAVLFHLPVTKTWLRQAVIGLVLLCHGSYRGVIEFLRDLLDIRLCIGTVHNIKVKCRHPSVRSRQGKPDPKKGRVMHPTALSSDGYEPAQSSAHSFS